MNAGRWQRVQELFHGAEAVEGADRDRYLETECAGDSSLRSEVEALLACGDGVELEGAVKRAAATTAAGMAGLDSDDAIANYRVVRRIGEGGMGVVYEAEQQNPRRHVALKLIQAGKYAGDRNKRLFQREVEALGRLKHPGIATIYESGTAGDGQPFLAMELVKGTSLDQWFESHPPLPALRKEQVRPRLGLFRSICDAIGYAHQNGVIHRDIKPSNIMVLEQPGAEASSSSATPVVKILDFGLARFTENYEDATFQTEAGIVQGSINYMSPEQARGDSGRIDLRTDVYSLGVVLYWLLTQHHPYLEKSDGLTTALVRVTEAAPRPFRHWCGRFDADLETIVLKALEKDPAQRYQSVSALTADLDRYLADLPIEARPPATLYQLGKLVRRHRAGFGALVLLLVLIIAFTATTLIQSRRVRAERDRANQEAATAKQVSEFLVDLFRRSNPAEAKGELTARDLLRTGLESARNELGNQPELQARLLDRIGRAYNVVGPFSEGRKAFEESIRIRTAAFGPDTLNSAESWSGLASSYYNDGDFTGAVRSDRRALAIREKHPNASNSDLAADLTDLASALSAQGDFAGAEPLLRRAVELDLKSATKSVASGNRLESLGNLLRRKGDFPEAIRVLRRAFEELNAAGGETRISQTLNELGMALNLGGEYKEAEQVLRHGLAVVQRIFGPKQANVAMLENNIAFNLINQERYVEAEATAREALQIFEDAAGKTHPRVADIQRAIALSLDGQGKMREAGELFVASLERIRKRYGADHVLAANASIFLGIHQVKDGHAPAGLNTLDSAIATLQEKGRGDSYDWAIAERGRGEAGLALGEWTQAETSLTQAHDWLASHLGESHPETLKALKELRKASSAKPGRDR